MCCGNNRLRGVIRLVATFACLGITWCAVLPMIGNAPLVRDHIELLERENVDASAMYYTDLEVMSKITSRGQRAMNAHRAAFYIPHDGPTNQASQTTRQPNDTSAN